MKPIIKKLKENRKLSNFPLSLRFGNMTGVFANLRPAKEELQKNFPKVARLNFCGQRPNQNTMNVWLNFGNAKDCADAMKLIEEKSPLGIKFLKIGETAEKFFT